MIEPAPARDARLWALTGRLPRAGGVDDQGAARLAAMLFAERVRTLIARKGASDDWARDLTREDLRLMRVLYDEDKQGNHR